MRRIDLLIARVEARRAGATRSRTAVRVTLRAPQSRPDSPPRDTVLLNPVNAPRDWIEEAIPGRQPSSGGTSESFPNGSCQYVCVPASTAILVIIVTERL